MYIAERLCGVFLYSLLVVFYCYWLLTGERRHYPKIFFTYCMALTIMAFFFIPIPESDISRWAPIIDQWAHLPLKEMFNYSFTSSNTPLAYLYMYVLGKVGGYRLVMAVTAFITYGNVFYILCHYSIANNILGKDIAITLFFYMSSGIFIDVISDVRYMIAFSILSLSMYREIFCKQKRLLTFGMYLVAGLFHLTAWAIIIIRIISLIFNRAVSIRKKIISIAVIALISAIIYRRIAGYLLSTYTKLESYLAVQHYSYVWEYIISLLIIITLLIVLRKSSQRQYIKNEYIELCRIFLYLSVVTVIEFNMFHRMTALDSIISMPVVAEYLAHSSSAIRKRNIIIISLFILLIACTRGHLCSYKFFVLQ